MLEKNLRKLIAICFLLTYVLLGIPLWYKLTTIYRATLPIDYIESLHNDQYQDVHLVIPVYIKPDVYKFPDIHDAVQIQINHLLNSLKQKVPWSLQILPYDDTIDEKNHIINLELADFVGYNAAFDSKETTVYYDDKSVASNDLPFFIAQTLIEHTFHIEASELNEIEQPTPQTSISVAYTPNVHLSISLLSGDGLPIGWDIETTLKDYFSPFRELLSPVVNFTVDTSIIYYNDLNLHSLNSTSNITSTQLSHAMDLSELSSMNYFSESVALNLAIVFPSLERNPNGFEFINSPKNHSNWQSFVVPQWGVITINKYPLRKNSYLTESYLNPIMYQFAQDLFELLGLTNSLDDELLSPIITIDSFKRITILKNLEKATETLWSLVKLTKSFQQMAIPKEVLENVRKALELRLNIVEMLNDPKLGDDLVWSQALIMSNQLVEYCETAFFHGEMLKQNFFPQEHKVAVYLPLLGPLTIVTLMGVIKCFKENKLLAKLQEIDEDVSSTTIYNDDEKQDEKLIQGSESDEL
ncbi:GPI-anchor transamidase GPI17 NDAI_0H01680 [Naumovozyma dairenensis CBS 421]|uniref:GPI transamidase component GPI17 n=1 Tax=Naumovozyma dairenensis (strain ATCC 10597 / BCRC 20456 / CBS 421 / NBRC 0211 / NRRL Y-12639) TaxID=1071378 RepID=G0WEY1_NAUDC|nr:hypothetical protein NDAI_0H01680 [Naumovozyma dairenensis CBS 421]CCD26342.1 hypothetical protein NDAI_0H01680 [Naumovozyma dairenensis CBS 421]